MKRLLLITAVLMTAFTLAIRAQDRTEKSDQSNPTAQTATPPPPRPEVPAEDRDTPAAPARTDVSADTQKDTKNSATTTDRRNDESGMRVAEHRRASQVIGMNIQNMQDETIGDVDDLVFDLSTRRVTAVVISSGGFLGIADELSIVPPSSLKLNAERDGFTVNVTKDQLAGAPRFQGTAYPDLNDPKYMLNVYKAYDAEPYLENLNDEDAADDSVRRVVRASEILGQNVKNRQDESIGDINEVILNASIDRVTSVVVSSGGFLGIGDTLSVLPAESVTATKEAVLVNATKETLDQSPRFNADAWPESMNDPDYLVNIYTPYQFRGDTKSDVDINASVDQKRKDANRTDDRKDNQDTLRKDTPAGVTAQDQGNNTGDVAVTTNIRRKLVADDDFSFSAKNIRVITREGKVTLAGEVASKEEMDEVLKIAEDAAGADAVTNQLTVNE